MIELKNLTCLYKEQCILHNITQKFPNHLTILGANGSGKTTLAKAICNLIPSVGTILIENKKTQEYTAKERAKKIAYIPAKLESYDAYITVEEFVLLSRFAYKKNFFDYTKSDREKAKHYIELLEIAHLADKKVLSLSSGEKALVLIAQALTQESQIIIFDEPTANLDPKRKKIVAKHIKELKQTRQTVLITHDIHLAKFLKSPVLFLKNKTALYFKENFFDDDNLSKLYDVKIRSAEVVYE